MSGINELKKKAKLSIDEMYDNQPVGKMDTQKEIYPEIHHTNLSAIHKESKAESNLANNSIYQKNTPDITHISVQPPVQAQNNQTNSSVIDELPGTKQNDLFPIKQQNIKNPTYKMTFNLSDDVYKAFNDLYAQRMLQGRKTEKSELICEAIQWLIKMEKEAVSKININNC